MTSQEAIHKIEEILLKKLEGDISFFLVDIKIHPGNKIQVFLDGDMGITIEKCAEMSRYIESYLDTEKWVGEKYVLEVSSPGMENPLKVFRQYKRRIGREVRIVLLNGEAHEGIMKEVDEQKVLLEKLGGTKKAPVITQIEIPFSDIKYTKLVLKF